MKRQIKYRIYGGPFHGGKTQSKPRRLGERLILRGTVEGEATYEWRLTPFNKPALFFIG